jgi:SDR family mycofactocin-dependent oxidoreductase
MGRLDGRVALVTGAARGQGRSHAARLANEGADVIAIDICAQIASVPYPMSTSDDLAETARQIEALGRRASVQIADVRDPSALGAAVAAGLDDVGPIDVVVANAGIGTMALDKHPDAWQDVIAVNLSGVFNTVQAVIPSMVERGVGGSVILISSAAGLTGVCGPDPGSLAYAAAKHGVLGLMRTYANNLGPSSIRVNLVAPTGVNTPMVFNDAFMTYAAAHQSFSRPSPHALPIDVLQPDDVSDAVVWLASDESRFVTGVALPVDAGFTNKN